MRKNSFFCFLWPNFNFALKFGQMAKDKGEDFIQSIMNTTRTIRNIMVSFVSEERQVVIDVLKKFASNIDYLRVCARNLSYLVEAVELVSNVVHLELVF